MQKTLLLLLIPLLLTACSGKERQYIVEFDTDNVERMADLTAAARRVIERRLLRHGGELVNFGVKREGKDTFLTVETDKKEVAEALNTELTTPFELAMMVEVEGEPIEGDISVEGHGTFRSVNVTQEDLDWVLGAASDGPIVGQGKVTVGFTEDGGAKMRIVFESHNGKHLGMFVRQQLAAKILLENEHISRTITIEGLPSSDLALVFADDVNVGTHMTFIPQ